MSDTFVIYFEDTCVFYVSRKKRSAEFPDAEKFATYEAAETALLQCDDYSNFSSIMYASEVA